VQAGDPEGELAFANPVLFCPLNDVHKKQFPSKRIEFEGHSHLLVLVLNMNVALH
jgi:hypothetical protein